MKAISIKNNRENEKISEKILESKDSIDKSIKNAVNGMKYTGEHTKNLGTVVVPLNDSI